MTKRAKVLVVNGDLDTLSKIYLALVHRNFKTEASDQWEEMTDRIKRFRPAVLVLSLKIFEEFKDALKIPAVVITEAGTTITGAPWSEVRFIEKPFSMDALIRNVEELVV